MLRELVNPKTPEYFQLKSEVLGEMFPWHCSKNKLDSFYFYGHTFLERPEFSGFPKPLSKSIDIFLDYFAQICRANEGMDFNYLLRMNANAVDPLVTNPEISAVHEDHTFPHKNVLIYLTDAGGETIVGDDVFHPEEDSIILFEGPHCHAMPKDKRRVVLVVTYA